MKATETRRTLYEFKLTTVGIGVHNKEYATMIVEGSIEELTELERLAEIGRAYDWFLKNRTCSVKKSIHNGYDKEVALDSDEVVEWYNEAQSEQLEAERNKLNNLIETLGMNHEDTFKKSQVVDVLVNKVQKFD